jgi:hypothetical protein
MEKRFGSPPSPRKPDRVASLAETEVSWTEGFPSKTSWSLAGIPLACCFKPGEAIAEEVSSRPHFATCWDTLRERTLRYRIYLIAPGPSGSCNGTLYFVIDNGVSYAPSTNQLGAFGAPSRNQRGAFGFQARDRLLALRLHRCLANRLGISRSQRGELRSSSPLVSRSELAAQRFNRVKPPSYINGYNVSGKRG